MSLPTKNQNALSPLFGRTFGQDFPSLQREMQNLMETFWGKNGWTLPQMTGANFPNVEFQENDTNYMIDMDLPGIEEKNVQIDLHNNVLTVKGEKKSESVRNEKGTNYSERYYGHFRRDFPFAEEVDPEKVVAQLKKGVLHLELTKKDTGQKNRRKIEIKT